MSQKVLSQIPQALINRAWSQLLLEELTRFGVQHVCIAPGSRSTPLTLEADSHDELTIHTHFDERGLGFFALGMAKASQLPVAVVVTSGTAVANLLPSIAEARLTGEKLVVLTADRPVELIDCGANQAIRQVGIFSDHVVGHLNLPSPSEQIPASWLLSSVDRLMFQQQRISGAVHINCPFPEPLYSDLEPSICNDYLTGIQSWKHNKFTYTSQVRQQTSDIVSIDSMEKRKGLIIIGKADVADADKVKSLADVLGWPVLCDPQSGISSPWQHYDLWLRQETCNAALSECDLIVQFGARIVSKTLNAFIRKQGNKAGTEYYLISDEEQTLNPDHLQQTHIYSNITSWVNGQIVIQSQVTSTFKSWADDLKASSWQVKKLVEEIDELTELGMAVAIPGILERADLFVGNSLIVRLLDMVTTLNGNRTYSNRGASGIDGLVATAAGVLQVNNEPLLTVLGDTSLLYDLNSLALFSHCKKQNVILVTNNDGGAIFDLLPVPQEKKEHLYQMPHGYRFKYAAKQFGLKYLQPDHMDELIGVATEHLNSGKGTLLIELVTPAGQASEEIKKLVQKVNAL